MAKRLIYVMVALALVAAGCGGTAPEDEMGSSGGMTTGMDQGMDTGSDETSGAERDRMQSTEVEDYGFETIYFDFDKYSLRNDAREALDHNFNVLRDNPSLRIVIEGHCDERGTDEYNLALGEKRAKAARDYLIRLGIQESRVTIISYGEERPVAMGHDESAWKLNRRGEFEPR